MTILLIGAGFLVFLGLIWWVHAADRYALERYGYAPFALPNALFMLIPHGLLILSLQGDRQHVLPAALAGGGMVAVLLLIRARTTGRLALCTAPILLLAAPLVVLTVLFRGLAQGGDAVR